MKLAACEDYAALEAKIGHSFADKALLRRALTHASVAASRVDSYERLEFLGDR
ncbi:MAG TPA: ribonuclease III, partial [Roseiarcus sp.]|nr:ribonuclease III [Roseiarcus sp.]